MKGFRYIVLFYVLFFWMEHSFAALPLDFTSIPTLANLAVGQVQELNYIIRNNVKTQSLPINISIVNDGDNQPVGAVTQTNTCGNSLAPLASCSITVTLSNLQLGALRSHLNIDYQGRAPLTSPLVLNNVAIANTTILVYIVGSDLESGSGAYATDNINQMEEIGSTANMNVVIETGGAKKAGWLTVKRQLIQKGSAYVLADLGMINMANVSTIQDFITWGIKTFPAQKYILVFWDHAGGPNGGFGGDENFIINGAAAGTPINQLITAVQGALSATGARLELIGFDTCLFGSAELASGLTPFAHYFVGSEDLEPGGGWQYNTFLSYVNSNLNASGLDIGKVIVDGFTEQNAGQTTTLSVVDLTMIPSLVTAVNTFSSVLNGYVNSNDNWKKIAQTRLQSADYNTSVWTNNNTDVVDLIGLAGSIQHNFTSDSDLALRNAAEVMILAAQNAIKYFQNSPNRGASLGLTTYFPSIMESYQSNYGSNVSLNSTPFYAANYINLLNNYNIFYQGNTSSLTATFSNFMSTSQNYTATLSNDFAQLYATVGSNSCTIIGAITPTSCLSAMQFSGISAQSGGGTTWNLTYNVSNDQNWPLINGTPALLIDSDINPQVQSEQTYLIPATEINPLNPNNNATGFLQLNNNNEIYTIVGFIAPAFVTTSTSTVPKVVAIKDGTQFYLRAYTLSNAINQCYPGSISGTWCLLNTNQVITAPFTITTGALPSSSLYNQFSFLAADLTGSLQLTGMLSYPPS